MKRQRNVNLLLMLVLLVAVGQMAQTIYIPAIADMARDLNVREGAVQSVMGAYLLTYGVSQLFYGPISDRVGRRPVILVGMSIFMLATLVAVTTSSLTVLIAASAMQGMGTGVGGVMARTLPRDLYERTQLRHANSLLNMGILVSPLLAPLIGGLLDTMWNWRACYLFLLVLCAGVTFSMARWMPETRPQDAPRTKLIASYKTLFGNSGFNCYLLMLIGGLAGIAAFEACSGVLLGAGRIKKEDSIDFAAGITMHKKLGDYVKAGESICTFYADDESLFAAAEEMYRGGLVIRDEPPTLPPLVYARVTSDGVERF